MFLRKSFLVVAALAASFLGVQSQQASAYSLGVEIACATDFYSYCSKHDPDGPGARQCMDANGEKLSQRCLNALLNAGEVSRAEVDRRTAAKSAKNAKK